eukprot:gene22874-biopygen10292
MDAYSCRLEKVIRCAQRHRQRHSFLFDVGSVERGVTFFGGHWGIRHWRATRVRVQRPLRTIRGDLSCAAARRM